MIEVGDIYQTAVNAFPFDRRKLFIVRGVYSDTIEYLYIDSETSSGYCSKPNDRFMTAVRTHCILKISE